MLSNASRFSNRAGADRLSAHVPDARVAYIPVAVRRVLALNF